jgi:hypothetical protein
MEGVEARLRALEDKEAIRDLLRAIARGTDRYDQALLAASIADDAVLDMGGETPVGGGAFVAALAPPAEPRPGRMHLLANERIEVDGNAAASESHILSCQDVLADGVRKTRIRAGRYLDRFERRGGAWQLVARTLVDEWGRIDPVSEPAPAGRNLGRPAPDDLSYR